MSNPRREIFRTAHEYFGAMADYCRALRHGQDMETPTQEVIGRSLFYVEALKVAGREVDAQRRVRAVMHQVEIVSRHYALYRDGR